MAQFGLWVSVFSAASGREQTAHLSPVLSILQITFSGEPSNVHSNSEITSYHASYEPIRVVQWCKWPERGQIFFCHKAVLHKFSSFFPDKVGILLRMNQEGIKITQEEMSRKSKWLEFEDKNRPYKPSGPVGKSQGGNRLLVGCRSTQHPESKIPTWCTAWLVLPKPSILLLSLVQPLLSVLWW